MFLFRISTLIDELRVGLVSPRKVLFFKVFYPIVLLVNYALFAVLIFGHRAVNHFFGSILGDMKAHVYFYSIWSYAVVTATLFVMVVGTFSCYWINKNYGDGVDFFRRFWMLGFALRCHIVFYALISFFLIAFYSNIQINKQLTAFTETIYPQVKKIKHKDQIKTRRSYVVSAFRSRGTLGFLPLVPEKIKTFFINLREIILLLYQLMSIFPVLLTVLHYSILAYYFKNKFGNKKTLSV